MVETYREQDGRKKQTSFCIVDAQSVKNTWTAGEKGYSCLISKQSVKKHVKLHV
ncbi:hypothetical protein [Bacillus thuringiensis]|uniref:hypothetical protein n=1 Tax=Bacillus thuringiensis TaxID=1428 RepID=UPI003F520693